MKFSSMTILGACFCLLLLAIPEIPRADIYRHVDANGVVHFTNTPTTGQFSFYRKEGSGGNTVGDIIRRYSSMFNLEEALIRAVIKAESNYNPRALSKKGAMGFMQLIPETARDMQVTNPFNPEDNIRGGSRYLRMMLNQFNDDLELALAAYNAGPATVRRYGGIPPFEETKTYVERVKKYLLDYRQDKDKLL
ncbi:MAG: lytic transglycosylase domain-containing protein [Desulfuromonadales bacterium]